MKNLGLIAVWAIIILLLGVILLNSFDAFTDSRADYIEAQGRARATIIEAQGQSRLDSAQAAAVTSTAMLPWLVVGLVGVLSVLGITLVAYFRPEHSTPERIETRIVFLPDASRRQNWEILCHVLQSTASAPALPAGEKKE